MLLTPFSPFPILETKRLLLREVADEDLPEVFDMRSDERVMKYIGKPRAKTPDDAMVLINTIKNLLAANDGITWAITLKGDDKLLGTLGLWRLEKENNRAEIGYALRYDSQGKGIMKEAIPPVLAFGFEQMKVHTIVGSANPENIASCLMMERNGFKREGTLRQNWFFNGEYSDSAIYGLLEEDYFRAKSPSLVEKDSQ